MSLVVKLRCLKLLAVIPPVLSVVSESHIKIEDDNKDDDNLNNEDDISGSYAHKIKMTLI